MFTQSPLISQVNRKYEFLYCTEDSDKRNSEGKEFLWSIITLLTLGVIETLK